MKPLGSLLGWLGAVFLLFAALSFLVQLFSGALILDELGWSLGNLVLGVVLIVAALAMNWSTLRERMHSGEARRAGKYGTSAVLGTALWIVLLGILAFLSTRYHTRWDFTEAQQHSLTSQSRKLLDGLERDVQVTALYAPVAAAQAKDLLERYRFASDRVKVEFVDPMAQPSRVAELGIDPALLEGGLLHVEIGDEAVDVEELTEQALTNAIVKLTRRERKKVYLLIGHNERPFEGEGADSNGGFAFAAEALRNENYEVAPLLLAAQGGVPEDADVVVAAGPTRPLHEAEHGALRRYLEEGGAMLVLLDPRAQTDLYEQVAEWGVNVGDDVIVDRVQGLFGQPTTPFAAQYADHPITSELRDAVLFHTARSVQPEEGEDGDLTWIVRTGEQSWAERDFDRLIESGEAEYDEGDLAGPVPVAVAGSVRLGAAGPGEGDGEGDAARIVVVGDSDFATNQLIREFRNRDFLLNSVNWLLGDVEAISVRPGQPRASRLQLTTEQFLQIRYLSLFVLPELIAVLGVIAWWRRRRAPGR